MARDVTTTSRVLDQHGRPVQRKVLTEEVAAPGLASVRQAFAPSVASGLTPQRLASILRACDEGATYEAMLLAEEMEERDPHYFSVLGTRKRAVSKVTPVVEAGSSDPKDETIAASVRKHIAEHDGFADLIEDALDALGKGYSGTEIIWGRTASLWWPAEFKHRPAHFFQPDRETGEEIRLRDLSEPVNGLALDPFKWVLHRAKLKSGLPSRGGLARIVAFSWMCKAYTLKDWMAFIETYGLPLRLGRYGPDATPKDVQTLYTAVANIGTDAAAVLPQSMQIDFEQVSSGSAGERIFETAARYVDEQISKAVLGQTMTSDNGSSESQAKVHNEVRLDLVQSDARSVAGTFNRDLVRPFVDLNFGPQENYPRLLLTVEEPEDIAALVDGVARLVPLGLRVCQGELRDRLGLSHPEKGDEVLGAVAPPSDDEPKKIALNSTDVEADPKAAPLEDIEDEMLNEWEEVMTPVLRQLEEVLADANGYEDAMDRLATDFPNLSSAPIIEALVAGMFKARVVGDDVSDG